MLSVYFSIRIAEVCAQDVLMRGLLSLIRSLIYFKGPATDQYYLLEVVPFMQERNKDVDPALLVAKQSLD